MAGDIAWLQTYVLMHVAFLWLSLCITVLASDPRSKVQPESKSEPTSEKPKAEPKQAPEVLKLDSNPLSAPGVQMAMYAPPASNWNSEEQRMISKQFKWKDLNENGVIDTVEHLEQLTLSVANKLRLHFPMTKLQAALESSDVSNAPMGLDDFKEWLWVNTQDMCETDTALPSECSKHVDEGHNDKPESSAPSGPTTGQKAASICCCILFPGSATNWPDRFAQTWIPIAYLCCAIAMLIPVEWN